MSGKLVVKNSLYLLYDSPFDFSKDLSQDMLKSVGAAHSAGTVDVSSLCILKAGYSCVFFYLFNLLQPTPVLLPPAGCKSQI